MVIGCGHAAKGCAKTRHVSCGTTAPLLALSRSSIDNDALTGSHGHHHGLPPLVPAQRVGLVANNSRFVMTADDRVHPAG